MAESKKKAVKVDLKLARHARLSNVRSQLVAEYEDVVGFGSSMKISPDIYRMPTGSLMLDYAMGGGLPLGNITMFRGDKGSGKTTHAIRLAATAQCLCRNCYRPAKITDVIPMDLDGGRVDNPEDADHWEAVGECTCMADGVVPFPGQRKSEGKTAYKDRLVALKENSYEEFVVCWVDAEMAFQFKWATQLGIDDRRLIYVRPETGEEAIDVIDPLLRSGAIDILVIDSIAHLIPAVEVTATTYDQQQGVQARLVNKGVRKFVSAMGACANKFGRVPTQIWINQEREKLGPFPGKVTPGGKGQGFAIAIEFRCWIQGRKVEKIEAGIKGEDIIVPQSEELHFKCEKNRTFPSQIEGFYRQILTDVDDKLGQIDEGAQIYRYAGHFQIVTREKKGGPLTCHLTEFTCEKVGEMTAYIDENIDEIKAELLRILLLKEK